MFYTYILKSCITQKFYTGWTSDLKSRILEHNKGLVQSTKHGKPWKLVYYSAFITEKESQAFEKYLKSGSGKAFAYKRLINVALKKDDDKGDVPSEA